MKYELICDDHMGQEWPIALRINEGTDRLIKLTEICFIAYEPVTSKMVISMSNGMNIDLKSVTANQYEDIFKLYIEWLTK